MSGRAEKQRRRDARQREWEALHPLIHGPETREAYEARMDAEQAGFRSVGLGWVNARQLPDRGELGWLGRVP